MPENYNNKSDILLARLDERTENLINKFVDFEKTVISSFATKQDIFYAIEQIKEINKELDEIRKSINMLKSKSSSYDTVKNIVYGMVGIILVAVVTATLSLIIPKGGT